MNLHNILEKTKNIRLIAASKYVGADEIASLHALGITEFGENQVQALANKKESLSKLKNIKWHFIGTLQSNKINHLLRLRPTLWQSCNSLDLALAVNKRLDYELDTLLELNSAHEASKSGLEPTKAIETYLAIKEQCPKIKLCGLMSIGAHTNDEKLIAKSFEESYKIYEVLQKYGAKICSMGMSSDFELAIKCGSNMVRLGSILFKSSL